MLYLLGSVFVSFLYVMFPFDFFLIVYAIFSTVAVIRKATRSMGVLLTLTVLLFSIMQYHLRNNEQFVEDRLFESKNEIAREYELLKEKINNNWKILISKNRSMTDDIGYRIYSSDGALSSWSGSEDFAPSELYPLTPTLVYYNNDISFRFSVMERGKTYYIRHYITAMYPSQDSKSIWLKTFERNNVVDISWYVTRGQMYINKERISFDDINIGEHIFFRDTNVLYTRIDASLLLKITSPSLNTYLKTSRKMFFGITVLIYSVAVFLLTHGRKRAFHVSTVACAIAAALPHPIVIIVLLILILIINQAYFKQEFDLTQTEPINYVFVIMTLTPVAAAALHILSAHTLIGAFVFGFYSSDFFVYLLVGIVLFLLSFFSMPHASKALREGLSIAFFIASLWISPIVFLFIVISGVFVYYWGKKTSKKYIFSVMFFLFTAFLLFYPILIVHNSEISKKNILKLTARIEQEVQKTIDKSVALLNKDEQVVWTLNERIHYDDNNFAFYKWSQTPLAGKKYPNFLSFQDNDGVAISYFAYKCVPVQTNFISTSTVTDTGDFWVRKIPVFNNNKVIGAIVIGIAKDFWKYDPSFIPLLFTRKNAGLVLFSSDAGQLPSTHLSARFLKDDDDILTVWVKKDIFIISRTVLIFIGILAVFALFMRTTTRTNHVTIDFRLRMMIIVVLFMSVPFVFSSLLIINNYSSSVKNMVNKEMTSAKVRLAEQIQAIIKQNDLSKASGITGALKIGNTASTWSIYKGPKRIASFNEDSYRLNLQRDYLHESLIKQIMLKGEVYDYSFSTGTASILYTDPETKLIIKLSVSLDKMQHDDFIDTVIVFMVINIILIIGIMKTFSSFIMNLIKPMNEMIIATKEISYGDFSKEIVTRSRIPEINVLLVNFNTMVAKLNAFKNNLNETQSFLREIIGSLPVAAMIYDKKRGITLYNKDMEGIAPTISVNKQPQDVLNFVIAFYQSQITELRYNGRIYRVTIRHFKYGYILLATDITRFVVAEKAQVWFDLAQEIAHELKNPLMPLEFSVNRLEKTLSGMNLDEHVRSSVDELLTVIREETHAISLLVQDFKEMTQRSEADTNPLTIADELDVVIAGFKPYPIFTHLSDTLPVVYFPVNKFHMIIKNILKNAIEADIQAKPIEIAAYYDTLLPEWETGELDRSKHYVIISFRDQAGGIHSELRDKLFEPFYSSKKGGSGLGLYIVKKIMLEYGNDIVVNVRENIGTDIYLIFQSEDNEQ